MSQEDKDPELGAQRISERGLEVECLGVLAAWQWGAPAFFMGQDGAGIGDLEAPCLAPLGLQSSTSPLPVLPLPPALQTQQPPRRARGAAKV